MLAIWGEFQNEKGGCLTHTFIILLPSKSMSKCRLTHRKYNGTKIIPAQTRFSEVLKNRVRSVLCWLQEMLSIIYLELVTKSLQARKRNIRHSSQGAQDLNHMRNKIIKNTKTIRTISIYWTPTKYQVAYCLCVVMFVCVCIHTYYIYYVQIISIALPQK